MRLTSLYKDTKPQAAVVQNGSVLLLNDINQQLGTDWSIELKMLIQQQQLSALQNWWRGEGSKNPDLVPLMRPLADFHPAPLLHRPGKIWGIGLNYAAHASDLDAYPPQEFPASFIKGPTTAIGPGETIVLPELSYRVTGEAELGIVIGKTCRNVPLKKWLDVVAGFTTILDMTAEDILRQNPRYLTVCKNFDTFFSFGPQLITPDEIPDIHSLTVETVLNGQPIAGNQVRNMAFPPAELIAFHSHVMTLEAGDVISTGTPGAVPLKHGDTIACRISGFPELQNPVIDLKEEQYES